MLEISSAPILQAALWLALMVTSVALVIVGMRRFRGSAANDRPEPGELLTKFRELHAQGGLSDEEYRTIKTKLASQLETELSDAGEMT